MKKSALSFTLLILSIPISLTLVSYYFLNKTKLSANHDYHIYVTDFIILFVSGILTFFIILKNYKRKEAILEKINQNNEAIRLSNERYDIVAKATSDTIWDWKLSDNSITWNKGIQGIFGYKKEDIIPDIDWWFSKIHSEDRLRMSVNLYSFVEERVERWQDQYRFECADGSYKYILDRGFLATDSNGKPIRMIGAMQDITKQKLEEERLKLLEMVIMQTKDAVIITEVNQSDNEIPKITYVNPAFTKITGYKSKDVLGKSASSFIHKEAINEEIRNLSIALKTKNEFNFESLNSRKSGENYWVNFSMIPINNNEGQHSHWISIQREITEEKKKEKEKEQLILELMQNNSDLKQFSYITSHNLRAPLSNLTGLLQLLEDIEIKDDELSEILNGFKISTNLLNETVNDLIKVIIIKDSPSMYKEKILVKEVFDSIEIQIKTLLNKIQPEIKLNLENAPYIYTNKSYLVSILLNLMTNSLKYKSERPLKIEITTSETETDFQLTFEDNGIGIDLELNKDKIFGLYQRFHDYPDSKGLGLYLVKSQIESLGGSIKVKSKVDQGTKFKILFKK
jgi:PAS domain S-box-containing protein